MSDRLVQCRSVCARVQNEPERARSVDLHGNKNLVLVQVERDDRLLGLAVKLVIRNGLRPSSRRRYEDHYNCGDVLHLRTSEFHSDGRRRSVTVSGLPVLSFCVRSARCIERCYRRGTGLARVSELKRGHAGDGLENASKMALIRKACLCRDR